MSCDWETNVGEAERFVGLMDRLGQMPDFRETHDYLKRIFNDYRDQCFKQAIANALEGTAIIDGDDSPALFSRLNDALESFLNNPFLSERAIMLNAWRLVAQIATGRKLAELHAELKERMEKVS